MDIIYTKRYFIILKILIKSLNDEENPSILLQHASTKFHEPSYLQENQKEYIYPEFVIIDLLYSYKRI